MRALPLAAMILAGCAAPVEADPRAADAPQTHVHIVTTRAVGSGEERTRARAAFVRVADERAVNGVALTLGLEPALPPAGVCRDETTTRSSAAPTELLDAGEVWLGDATGAARLVARAFPDVLGVSGVVYTTAGDAPALVGERAWVRFGGGEVEHAELPLGVAPPALHAERTPSGVRFDGGEAGDRTWVDVADGRGARRCTAEPGRTSIAFDAEPGALVDVHRDRRRVDGVVTVRAEIVQALGRSIGVSP
ncbi:MAG: hypothetical protein IT374_11625 [Polyangiaceae bacterium]|nr:hypothetical protein [Polyangiaceae bacterium]